MPIGPNPSPEAVVVPRSLPATVMRWNGWAGRRWLADLPAPVSDLAREWSLTLGSAYSGVKCALVLRASQENRPVVLKLSWPDVETRPEPDALRLWQGDGAVHLLAVDERRGALLLERLDPGTPLADHPDRDEALEIVCGLVRRLRRQPPASHRFPRADGVARATVDRALQRWRVVGEPFEPALIDAAITAAEALLSGPSGAVVVNRDLHLGNVLAAQREPWQVIDPKPMVGEPSFDGGHLLADALEDGAVADRVEQLVAQLGDGLGVDRGRLRGWALVRAVDVALWTYEVAEGDAAGRLTVARALAEGAER